MRKPMWWAVAAVAIGLGAVGLAPAWWVKGHGTITEAAAAGLPDDVPAFFRAAGRTLAHCAGDPDRWKNKAATFLNSQEAPNHYLDLEDLQGNELPPNRDKGMELMRKLNRDPAKVGLLPYAVMEGFDKLTVAFKDYRDEPNNPAVPMKCLVHAGTLAHYTTDAAMPLHSTVDYDGRVQPDGSKLMRGIHAKIDGYPETNGFTPEEISRGVTAREVEDVWKYVNAFIRESHTHVNTCYDLHAAGAIDKPTDESRKFILERCRAGAQFTADIWYTAWKKSAKLPPSY